MNWPINGLYMLMASTQNIRRRGHRSATHNCTILVHWRQVIKTTPIMEFSMEISRASGRDLYNGMRQSC